MIGYLKFRMFFRYFIIFFVIMSSNVIADELLMRNPYNIDNYVESEHFVIYWGSGITASDVHTLADFFELNWQFIIEEKQFKRPNTTKLYKENIYISGTGQPLLDDELGAIQGLDREGHEHIIMHKDSLFDRNRLEVTAVHEFFHSIQQAYNIPDLSPRLWLGEATATWSGFMSLPEQTESQARNGLTQFAFYPQYSLDVVMPKQPEKYNLLEGHNYGAYIFFVHLTEYFGDQDLVLKLFQYVDRELPNRESNIAIDLVGDFLTETYAEDLRDVFHHFVTRNAVWDYPDQQAYLNAIYVQDNGMNNEHTAAIETALENKWKTIESKYIPHKWGANYVKLIPGGKESFEVGFEGNSLGNLGSEAIWRASIVTLNEGMYEYLELPLSENKIDTFNIKTNGDDEIWLAMSVSSESHSYDELFAYRYQFGQIGQSESSPNSEVKYKAEPAISPTSSKGSGGGNVSLLLLCLCGFVISIRQSSV